MPCHLFWQGIRKQRRMNKKKWNTIKRTLPRNWAQEVSKSLSAKGFRLTARQISDVKRGKVKDPETNARVLKEIRSLSARIITKQKSLSKIL